MTAQRWRRALWLAAPLALGACGGSPLEARAAAAARAERLSVYQQRAQRVAGELAALGFAVRATEVALDSDAAAPRVMDEAPPALRENSRAALEALRRLLGLERPLSDLPAPERDAPPVLPVQYDPTAQMLLFHEPLSLDEPALDFALAHALAHVHQDQAQGGVEAFLQVHSRSLDDSRVARALLEGQALLVAHAVLLGRRGLDAVALDPAVEDARRSGLSGGEGAGAPSAAGLRFALWIYRQGGWPALLEAYRQPPSSSEQLLHPSKYGRDTPRVVTLPRWPDASDAVEQRAADVLGELALSATLAEALARTGEPLARAAEAAALGCVGWEGDRFEAYELADGRRAALWRSVWDLDESAQAFTRVLARASAINRVPEDTLSVRRRGSVVDVAFSEDPSYLTKAARALAGHIYDFPSDLADAESTRAAGAELVARFAASAKMLPVAPGAEPAPPSAAAPDR
jgi:hypothetical protein